MKTVFIHTPADSPTANLWEKTIRVGFPTAEIRPIKPAGVYKLHSEAINELLEEGASDPDADQVIFCDPDMIFYDNVEETLIDSGQLMSGRHVAAHYNEVFKAWEAPRLHTSLLYIPSPSRLRLALQAKTYGLRDRFGLSNWWAQQLTAYCRQHFFFDTGACVFGAIDGGDTRWFTTDILDNFTHLNCGTMLDDVAPLMADGDKLRSFHQLALSDPEALRGLWRKQDQYYAQHQNYADCLHP